MNENVIFRIKNGVLVEAENAVGDVVIPDGVKSIRNWAFSWCSTLTSVTIPKGVTSIGKETFRASSLTSLLKIFLLV